MKPVRAVALWLQKFLTPVWLGLIARWRRGRYTQGEHESHYLEHNRRSREQTLPSTQWAFLAITAMALVWSFLLVKLAYSNPVVAVAIFWVGSVGMTQVWTRVFGDFWAISPRNQYPSFLRGDLIWLPLLTALPIQVLMSKLPAQEQPYLHEKGWYVAVAGAGALALTAGFRWMQSQVFPRKAMNAPWKAWHDLWVYPTLSFLLFLGAPVIWYSDWGLQPLLTDGRWQATTIVALLPFIGAGLWLYDGIVSDRKMDVNAPNGIVKARNMAYDWNTGQVIGPLQVEHLPNGKWRWRIP